MTDRAAGTVGSLAVLRSSIGASLRGLVVGQDDALDSIVAAIGVGGHVLLEGVPGVAKTLIGRSVANALSLSFRRLQFTPDLLPTDLTGTMVLRGGDLEFRPGPVFTNILLADEINRTPPKTQAALLEAMEESQVTTDGHSRPLPEPFVVLATQNPIEYEGTYPLPEAQLDRFFVRVQIGYPSEEEEREILRLDREGVGMPRARSAEDAVAVDFAAVRAEVERTTVSEDVLAYVVGIVRATRTVPSVEIGASPRATTHLLAGAKAVARLAGRDFCTPDDVVAIAVPVLAHRLVLSVGAELEGTSQGAAVATAVAAVDVPR